MKRFLCTILSVIMLFSLTPATAQAFYSVLEIESNVDNSVIWNDTVASLTDDNAFYTISNPKDAELTYSTVQTTKGNYLYFGDVNVTSNDENGTIQLLNGTYNDSLVEFHNISGKRVCVDNSVGPAVYMEASASILDNAEYYFTSKNDLAVKTYSIAYFNGGNIDYFVYGSSKYRAEREDMKIACLVEGDSTTPSGYYVIEDGERKPAKTIYITTDFFSYPIDVTNADGTPAKGGWDAFDYEKTQEYGWDYETNTGLWTLKLRKSGLKLSNVEGRVADNVQIICECSNTVSNLELTLDNLYTVCDAGYGENIDFNLYGSSTPKGVVTLKLIGDNVLINKQYASPLRYFSAGLNIEGEGSLYLSSQLLDQEFHPNLIQPFSANCGKVTRSYHSTLGSDAYNDSIENLKEAYYHPDDFAFFPEECANRCKTLYFMPKERITNVDVTCDNIALGNKIADAVPVTSSKGANVGFFYWQVESLDPTSGRPTQTPIYPEDYPEDEQPVFEANKTYVLNVNIDYDSQLIVSSDVQLTLNGKAPEQAYSSFLSQSYFFDCVNHNYAESITVPATCVSEGELTHTCTVCGYYYTELIPLGEHDLQPVGRPVSPTCTSVGYTEGYKCVNCDYELAPEELPMLNHRYESVVVKKATCSAEGLITYTCSMCGNSYDEIIPLVNHDVTITGQSVPPTCTSTGSTAGMKCKNCDFEVKESVIPMLDHSYASTTTKATTSADGKIVKKCSSCGKTSTTTIKKVATVKLSATKYTYDGKVKNPTLTIKDSAGKALVKGTDYTVTTPSGRKNVGKYTYKITFKGNYSGTKSLSFVINPKNTSISKLTATKGGFKATIKKYTTQTTGYQIRYSTKSNMSGAKTVTIAKNTTTSKSVTGLSKGKKYYVQIRTFKTVNGTKYYSAWSGSKTVTTKK